MPLFLGTVAAVALVVLGLWQPLMWIGAGLVVALMVLYAIGLTRVQDPVDEPDRVFVREYDRLPSRR